MSLVKWNEMKNGFKPVIVVDEVKNCIVMWFGEEQHKRVEKRSTETTAAPSLHCAVNTHAHSVKHGMHLVCIVFQTF